MKKLQAKISGVCGLGLSISTGRLAATGMIVLMTAAMLVSTASGYLRAEMLEGAADFQTMVHITVQPEARISAEEIYLKDIAVIRCANSLKTELAGLKLGRAPRPGRQKRISGRRIAAVIRSKQWIPNDAQIDVPARVTIRRDSQALSEERLKRLFVEYVHSKLPDDAEVGIRQFKIRGLRPLPDGTVAFTVEPRDDELMGRVTLRVGVTVDGRPEGKLYLSAWVDRYAQIVCARHSLIRDAVLTAGDLCLQRENISKAPANFIRSMDAAIGKRLKQTLAAGDSMRDNMLENPPLIYKGDRVKLIAGKGALKIETLGIAKERGGKGEQLRVENVSSGKTVVGRVIDASTVEVLF